MGGAVRGGSTGGRCFSAGEPGEEPRAIHMDRGPGYELDAPGTLMPFPTGSGKLRGRKLRLPARSEPRRIKPFRAPM